MAKRSVGAVIAVVLLNTLLGCGPVGPRLVVVCPVKASFLETLAAREVRRYVYLRTGELAAIMESNSPDLPTKSDMVILSSLLSPVAADGTSDTALQEERALKAEAYTLKTVEMEGHRAVMITGSTPLGTLYGAYRLAEHLGVRFYLHGDVVPDEQVLLNLPVLNEVGKPLFSCRGIQPFHDFPEGPDWWSLDGYKAIISQLPKLRMNFIGLHTYPEGGVGPEPTVWIGLPEDVSDDGRVRFSYPARHFSTVSGTWGYQAGYHAKTTGGYAFGSSQLYEHDAYAQDVQVGMTPWPATPEDCNTLFNRFGDKLRAAFEHAHQLGVKTCVGTEVPLIVPKQVRERVAPPTQPIQALGGNVASTPASMPGTDDVPLYQTVRWSLDGYQFKVPNGRYKVTLRFAEIAHNAPGLRVFGVKIQNKQVLEDLDIFAKVGKDKPLNYTYEDIAVADGTLAVDFTRKVEHPCVAAIAVEGAAVNLKVNCGGPAYKDYQADEEYPVAPEDIQRLYEGIFLRLARTCLLDYYWFWTPEGWTWSGVDEATVRAALDDIKRAITAAKKVNAPFRLATCGWVLGPQYDRSLFDREFPKDMPVSCINRAVGHDPVEPGFAQVTGRPKWAIPWLEDDPALASPQLWAGRMRKDALDALDDGCTGLMGIHWRTRILGPNIAALAQGAWDQTGWRDQKTRIAGPEGGKAVALTGQPIANTKEADLYQTMRCGMSRYGLEVPNGTYRATLQFCEPTYGEKGKRVFGVKIQGKPVVDALDLVAKAGRNTAVDLTFEKVLVTEGWLDIEFVPQVEQPCIAAIALFGPYGHKKINCGGPAYKDYEADPQPTPATGRYLAVEDFYRDWARCQFGGPAAEPIGSFFARIDGHLPRPTNWVDGPGGINPDTRPWDEVSKEYTFVGEMTALRSLVHGAGNLERFDYWLGQFFYMEANARVNCIWARYNEAFKKVEAVKDAVAQKRLARDTVVPLRVELVQAVGAVYRYLLETVSNTGEMGTITNWQQHILPKLLEQPGEALAKMLGESLPPEAMPSSEYTGLARVFIPEIRTSAEPGEVLNLKVVILDRRPPQKALLCWRPMGAGAFRQVNLAHVGRAVWSGRLATDEARGADLEYYVEVLTDRGEVLHFPPTAPKLNQTVVVPAGA